VPSPRRRRRRKANPEWVKRRRLYDKDGTYDRILEAQNGVCGICGAPPGKRRLHLDHDHKTLEIRGILCFPCNSLLRGRVTLQWLENAIRYMSNPPERSTK
jgi:hypothetical protein